MHPYRKDFHPVVPRALENLGACCFEKKHPCILEDKIQKLFPHLIPCSVLRCVSSKKARCEKKPLRVGVFFSGGPAPGGHDVVAGLFDALHEWHKKSRLIGFLDGPKGVLRNSFKELQAADIEPIRNTGGFSLLGSGRSKIESQEDIEKTVATVTAHDLDGLVVVGGDDSNTDAAFLAEAFLQKGVKTVVIGVPKTIDGDLQSEDIAISFGFDTACKVYSEIVGNIAKDALSAKKYYYFIRLMGRAASHITLECALETQPNLALISEEAAARSQTLKGLVDEIAALVVERAEAKRYYGVILVPEGLVEHLVDVKHLIEEVNELFAPTHPLAFLLAACSNVAERLDFMLDHLSTESKACLSLFPRHIAEEFLLERDPHGNVQVSRIETERLLAGLVEAEVRNISRNQSVPIPFAAQTGFFGYEGRSAFPSNFDCTYCYSLGRLAVPFVAQKLTGFMAALSCLHEPYDQWEPLAVPLVSLLQFERRKGKEKAVVKKTFVDLQGPVFSLFKEKRKGWRLSDEYVQPGPMQFWGPEKLTEAPCCTIILKKYDGKSTLA